MFDKKQYYTSSLSLRNRYCVKKELERSSCYERCFIASDEYDKKYVILFERIDNSIPDEKVLLFETPIHNAIVYPIDLIIKTNVYVHENEIGYVYPAAIRDFIQYDHLLSDLSKKDKAALLGRICLTLEDLHKHGIFLFGFDKKQILIKSEEIRIRYNGFRSHNRNSVYKVPDFYAENFSAIPWILDAFSIVAIIFECMYEWNPFCGALASFSRDEEYQFEVFYNNFRKKIFIFERDKNINPIGFLIEQRPIVEKWAKTDRKICDFFRHILTMDIPEKYTKISVYRKIHKLIDYYYDSELFE